MGYEQRKNEAIMNEQAAGLASEVQETLAAIPAETLAEINKAVEADNKANEAASANAPMKQVKRRIWKVVRCSSKATPKNLHVEQVLNAFESIGWTMVNILADGYTGMVNVYFARVEEISVPMTPEEINSIEAEGSAGDGEELVADEAVIDDEAAVEAFAADVLADDGGKHVEI